jgi:3-mercaptopyruvate sulfurtransferase SseA
MLSYGTNAFGMQTLGTENVGFLNNQLQAWFLDHHAYATVTPLRARLQRPQAKMNAAARAHTYCPAGG